MITSRLRTGYRGLALLGTASMTLATVLLLVLPNGWFKILAVPFVLGLLATLRLQFIKVVLIDDSVKVTGLFWTRSVRVDELDGWATGPERASFMLSLCAGHTRHVEPVFLIPRSGNRLHVQVLDVDTDQDRSHPLGELTAQEVFSSTHLGRMTIS